MSQAPPVWEVEPPHSVGRHLLHAASRREFAGVPVQLDDPVLAASLREQDDRPQWEYAYRWQEPCRVEPSLGYVVTGAGRLVAESLPYWRHIGFPVSPPPEHVVRVPAVVSLRDTGDTNYYHFLDDVLGRLELADRIGVPADLPLLVSAALAERPYFRQALARSARLRARQWLVQPADRTVEADEVWFLKAMPHSRRTLSAAADLLEVPAADPGADRRVLLVRAAARSRHVRNAAEVEQVCGERGFELVDADELDLDEQIALFAEARHVVGPHGAGLVNLLWRRGAGCSLLELFPPDASPAHYHWLCASFGYSYDALRGVAGSTAAGFDVDPEALARAVDRMTDPDQLPGQMAGRGGLHDRPHR